MKHKISRRGGADKGLVIVDDESGKILRKTKEEWKARCERRGKNWSTET